MPGPRRSPGEGNGNPLQYSCLENPRTGAWWPAIYGVAQSWTRLRWLRSSLAVWLVTCVGVSLLGFMLCGTLCASWTQLTISFSMLGKFSTIIIKCLVTQSCLTLCEPMDYSPPGSSVHGILQASLLEWVAVPFSRGSSQPMDWTHISGTAGKFFTIWATREATLWESSGGSLIR